ncbi:hypothetical protein B0T16DRAFT_419812 [Cercophora newfieldiana]|uniref:Uncharacterized protein n=1 Tax=Cercophora newfieldiana TaxID=92897 RepID=A0AA39XWJ4_9PEZI|nr:hypothetical protein B0T16DRAFT_419812 [Cercophora newfieldiana]
MQGGISVLLSAWLLYKDPEMRGLISPGRNLESKPASKAAIEAAKELIKGICDSQIFAGTALLIAAFATQSSLTLYHYHIIYDITNFTAISFCAALVHVSKSTLDPAKRNNPAEQYVRVTLSFIFAVLHLAFSILYGRALQRWDWTTPGRCYNTRLIAHPAASHPYVDKIYLGMTCFYMQAFLIMCVVTWLGSRDGAASNGYDSDDEDVRFWAPIVIMGALYQYPLHLYSTVALRVSNEGLLEGDSENSWGFGQVIALVLVVDTLIKCGTAYYNVLQAKKGRVPEELGVEQFRGGESLPPRNSAES